MTAPMTAAIKAGLLAGGWYAHRLERDCFPGVLVACYHGIRSSTWRRDERSFANLHVAADTFEGHLRVFRDLCHPISLDHWRAALAGQRTLPDRPVLVTFDDGYRSVFEVGRPLLKRYGVPATVFACTEPIRRQRLFWFDALAREGGESAVAAWGPEAAAAWGAEAAAAGLARYDMARADPADPLAPMTIDQVRQLADDGFEIGAHTATHPRLSSATKGQQREELDTSRDTLAQWIGGPVRALAYPFGKPGADYTQETVGIASDLGFDFAFNTYNDFARPNEHRLERSRMLVVSEVTPPELAHRIAYSWRR